MYKNVYLKVLKVIFSAKIFLRWLIFVAESLRKGADG